ncbi:MAG: peptidoglycan DD-metalloendopeptidase family protein [Clostridia bacterium]|nr:peptidoglycan DD-metalloendopeptidase family protein [Clostridia bacterium]
MLVTELLTYIDGKLSYTSTVSRVQTKAPVNEIILVGTKQGNIYSWYSGGSYYQGSFIWPTRGANAISSYYGYRNPGISGWGFHGGIDIITGYGNSTGVPVVASASGTVVSVTRSYRGYGHMVLIDHGGGLRTRYAHMQPGSLTVYVGQRVSMGQQIGRIGSTGNSTGPHLHFEVLLNGVKQNPLNYVRR